MPKSIKDVRANPKVTERLLNDLKRATVEKGVEHAYWRATSDTFKAGQPSDSDQTDGFIEVKYTENELFLLFEFKFDKNLYKRSNAIRVIIQTVFYMHDLRDKYAKIPNVIMIGDKHNAFVMNTKSLLKYLDIKDIDWSISPSSAAEKYKKTLFIDMNNDSEISYYLHSLNNRFSFNDLVDDISVLISKSNEKIKLTASNINVAFDQFINRVITNKSKLSAEDLVNIFITVAIDRANVFINSTGSKISVNNLDVSVNKANYSSFVRHFDSNYRPSEKRYFTEISDRLIQDVERRKNGEFYTPSSFVNFAQERLSKFLGIDWRDSFTVWDPAWGTGNLTRDNGFQNLFASTLNQSDLDQGKQYNRGATKFVFNFLNDDYEFENSLLFQEQTEKLPKKLVDILVNNPTEKFLFFLNPPYATAGNANSKNKSSKSGISKTPISEEMKGKHLKVQEQLYAQFIYRIIKIKEALNLSNVYIGMFSPSLFLTGPKFNKFRNLFLKNFEFLDGNLFKASYFSNVNSNWAIDFSIWKSLPNDSKHSERSYYGDFLHNVLSLDDLGKVRIVGTKTLWNTDDKDILSLQDYLNNIDKDNTTSTFDKSIIQFTSRYKSNKKTVNIPKNVIGYLFNDSNNIEASTKGSYLMSNPITRHIKKSEITESSFARQMIVFAARKSINATWLNQKDEFLAPNENNVFFNRLMIKSVIFSIFHPSNNVISYREEYQGLDINNLNPWFFISKDQMMKLADKPDKGDFNEQIYNDAMEFANVTPVMKFIDKHRDDLDKYDEKLIHDAKNIVKASFRARKVVNDDFPEFSVNTWDASWNQILKVANEYTPDLIKDFDLLFKEYTNSVRSLVYEVGMMRK